MHTLGEGIESLKLACSLVLLIPALGVVLFGRRRVWLVPIWIAVATTTAWLRFTGWWDPFASGWTHALVGVALAAVVVLAWKRNDLATDSVATAGAAFLASWTWIPCVGSALGDILNNARSEPWAQLFPTVLYMVGLFVPLILIAALQVAWPEFERVAARPAVRNVGLAIVFGVGTLVAVTLYDDLAGELARRSSF